MVDLLYSVCAPAYDAGYGEQRGIELFRYAEHPVNEAGVEVHIGAYDLVFLAGLEQAAATQHGIGICFVLAPAILSALLLVCAILFPLTDKEFRMVQKDIARRKGTEQGEASEEEKEALRKVTGFDYEDLWNPLNATLKKKA